MLTTETRHVYPEGKVATTIERQTVKWPSDWFLWAAGAVVIGSLALQATKRKHEALFVGEWVPTLLLLGLYNKLVKMLGTDEAHNA